MSELLPQSLVVSNIVWYTTSGDYGEPLGLHTYPDPLIVSQTETFWML